MSNGFRQTGKPITSLKSVRSAVACRKTSTPAVDKGIRDAMERGINTAIRWSALRPFWLTVRIDVDSNRLSFKMAARLAYKAGIPQANPVILEPVCSMKNTVPDAASWAT